MKKLIDCFTFYNELEMLELRLTELYDVVDKFILVESDLTHKGENKRFFFEDNKWRYEKWADKIIHVKITFPLHLDTWGREKYQRNSFMTSLYSLGLSNEDIVVITDLDEIPDSSTLSYIKTSYPMKGLFKLEMDHYWASIYNKMVSPEKWYHAKIVDWETLKGKTPDECRLDFNCQWWERGGWHLSYFGGPDFIVNKINNMAHQELNHDRFKVKSDVIRKVKEGLDLFDEWRKFEIKDPLENPYLPKNWKILLANEEKYGNKIKKRKNLLLGAAINLDIKDIKIFIESFRTKNASDDIYMLIEESSSEEKIDYLKNNNVNILYFGSREIIGTQPNNYRFLKFFDFLKENNRYDNVLISDVSDVYFQSDPFDGLNGDYIFFAEEEDSVKIGENDFNSRWILQCFGKDELDKIKKNPILCCGTIIGSYKNIFEYCKKSSSEMMRVSKENRSAFSDMMDQGIHNYICYNLMDMFTGGSIKKNGDFFATVGITCSISPGKITKDGSLILVNGKNPKIIHQYNRSHELTESIISKMELSNIEDNITETDIEEISILTLKNDAVGSGIIDGNSWEPHVVSFIRNELKNDSVFIDIGSNYGWHSLIASRICQKVYSFEPQKMMYLLQKESILRNKALNVDLYQLGLGSIDTESNLSPIDYKGENLNIGDLGIGSGGEKIKISTLDSFNIQKVDIIKIDVQGYEKYVLDGAINTILDNRPILILEIEEFQLSKFGFSSLDIVKKIKSFGYEIYLMDHTYPSDHVCVPLEKIKDFEERHKITDLLDNNNISNSYLNGIRKKLLRAKKKSCVFTIVKNEKYFLPKWIKYYSKFFKNEDIYILDHQSNDGSTINLDVNFSIVKNEVAFDHYWLSQTVSDFQNNLLEKYECVIFSEVDEIIYSTEKPLNEAIDDFIKSEHRFLNCKCYEVCQKIEEEENLLEDDEIFKKRKYWFRHDYFDKQLISKIPLRWGIGFHTSDLDEKKFEMNFYMCHLHRFDFEMMLQRNISRIEGQKVEDSHAGRQNKTTDREWLKNYFNEFVNILEIIPENHKKYLYDI